MNTLIDTTHNLRISDTLHNVNNYVTQSDLTTLYSNFLSSQSSSYSTLITVLLSISAILIGSTVIWNFYIARNQIKLEVNNGIEQLALSLKSEMKQTIAIELEEHVVELEKKFKLNEADLAGLYAVSATNLGFHLASVVWWLSAIGLYNELNINKKVRVCVDELIDTLNQPNCFDEVDENYDFEEKINQVNETIPEILSKEKDEIVEIFRQQKIKIGASKIQQK
jgi:hypothetical protein